MTRDGAHPLSIIAATPPSLHGRAILVTRPADQASALAGAIEQRGGSAVLMPTIEIRPRALSAEGAAVLADLAQCDFALFISANAVTHGLRHVTAWPAALPALAVGQATARALERHGITQVIMPDDGADSEALLRLPALSKVRGRRIVIFRGAGGRELLANTLRQRGARVDYVETYERLAPMTDPAPVVRLCENDALHAICVSSAQGIENLFAMAGEHGAACLRRLPLFVPHPRLALHARSIGVHQVIVCAPGDEAMVAALEAHFRATPEGHSSQ